ncbi:AAA family ATPase [Phytoactinopolyspora endophytica]|uniref:AAA family ATPase n=1 Tax=Phytoactinopolyspora endophytica TaxID=1642495 RepID=UPI00101CC0E0|nr:AAA family ATPase [Phytoactinopolyspora endophytica]
MFTVLITGVSGSGKSAISRWLAERGREAVSLDGYEGLCMWVDRRGRPVQRPENPTVTWLSAHEWVWNADVLDRLITSASSRQVGVLWLAGNAGNVEQLHGRFDLRILLRIDAATMLARLDNASRGNDFGRIGESRVHLVENFEDIQNHLRSFCDIEIDAAGDLDTVGHELLTSSLSRGHDAS